MRRRVLIRLMVVGQVVQEGGGGGGGALERGALLRVHQERPRRRHLRGTTRFRRLKLLRVT